MGAVSTSRALSSAAVTARAAEFQPLRGLRWLGGFAAFGIGLSALYAATGRGFGCPFRAVTGWDCPFCGGTRLGSALLHGDVATAFAFNPLVFVGLVALTVTGVLWVVELLGGPSVRPPARVRRITTNQWLVVAAVVAVVFTLARNLL
jgi:uncharacterized protein DUF2752